MLDTGYVQLSIGLVLPSIEHVPPGIEHVRVVFVGCSIPGSTRPILVTGCVCQSNSLLTLNVMPGILV